MHTRHWLGATGLDVTLVCDDRIQAAEIRGAMPYVPRGRIIDLDSRGVAPGCLNARNFILSELVKPREWYIGIDDNVEYLDIVHPEFYDQPKLPVDGPCPWDTWRKIYRHAMASTDLPHHLAKLRDDCRLRETIYGGFASTENPMFRASKYGYRRFVKTKLYVLYKHKPDLLFKGGDYAHDSWMSAYAVANFGSVVVNNYIHPRYPWFEAGGLGKVTERRAKLDVILDEIIAEFPGLVVKAKGANSALKFIRTTDTSVQRWQAQNNYPRT
jgi:hypothetical protein